MLGGGGVKKYGTTDMKIDKDSVFGKYYYYK